MESRTEPAKRILVVDDLPQNIELLEAFLLPLGYEILAAENGLQALKIVAEKSVDLVLLDVMMPGMDGFEVTRRIRKDEKHHNLPIVLVTALRETEDRVKGIEAGCDDFISKPVDKMELAARVRSLLKIKAYNDLLENYRKDLEREVAAKTEELRLALKSIKDASLETILRLSMACEYKDEDTGAHIKRLSQYAVAVARQMAIDDGMIESIAYAAPMHDLGKLGIPDFILLKPAKLSPAEWEIIKKHTIIGAQILKGSSAEFIRLAEIIAYSHHEKWDGSGYPEGLKGESIPLAGRIIAIADVFDALTSKRPYKEPYSVEKSQDIIREQKGIHFDPAVVDAFFAIQGEIAEIKKEHDDNDSKIVVIPELVALMKGATRLEMENIIQVS
jgi:putative two-component system response regulator